MITRNKKFARTAAAVMLATGAAVFGLAAPASADHGAYMVHSVWRNSFDCNRNAVLLNANPFDDWADAHCVHSDSRWWLIAKHV